MRRELAFLPPVSRSFFFLFPNKEEKMPSLSFFPSPLLRLLSFFLSSDNLLSILSRSSNKLSLPRWTAVSIECCNTSSRALSCDLSTACFVFPRFNSSSFLLSFFSFSSLPLNHAQVDFLGAVLSGSSLFDFLSDFLSSVIVGIKVKLSVLALLPGNGEGCCAISINVCPADALGIGCDVDEACRPTTGLLLDRGGGSSRGLGCCETEEGVCDEDLSG